MLTIIPKSQLIQNKRLRVGMSLRQAAEAAKINPCTLLKIENGQRVRPQTAKAVCGALRAEFDELFEIVQNEKR